MNKYKTLDKFLADLDDHKKAQVLKLREFIIETEPLLEEHIKWNAPSYVLDGEDRITFNTLNKQGVIKLVFHMGATRKEDKKAQPVLKDAQLIEWVSDIRGYATFNSIDDIAANEVELKQTIKNWLGIK